MSENNGRIKILINETYRNYQLTKSNVLKYGLEPQKLMQFVEKEIDQIKEWCIKNNVEIIECTKGHITYLNSCNVLCMEKYSIMELNEDMNEE